MNTETDILTPFVNTDVKIPRRLRDALTMHETSCCMRGVKTVTVGDVQQFLTNYFDSDMAALFTAKYLLKSPSV
jgi:hypothetical protein